MWVFRLRGHNRYLATNPKVMTRTLLSQTSLERVVSRRRWAHFALKAASARLPPEYVLLARDPFTRVGSFFQEKLRHRVRQALEAEAPYLLKRHQTIFYPWIGTSTDDPVASQVEALLSLTFDHFVDLIPEVWRLEVHLAPQTYNYTRRILGRPTTMRFDDIVHIEDSAAMAGIAERFKLDLTIRRNRSDSVSEVVWTEASRSTIRDVYRRDFDLLGYEDGALR